MKKVTLALILLSMFLVSCTKEEDSAKDNNATTEEQTNFSSSPLIGSWKYFGYKDIGNNSDELRDVDDCEDNNIYVFNADGTYEYRAYQMNAGECIVRVNQTGTWKPISDVKVELTYIREPENYIYELDFTITDDVMGITDVDGVNTFSRKYRLQ